MSEPRYSLDDFNDLPQKAPISANGAHPGRDSWLPLNLASLPDKPPVQPTMGGFGIVYPGKRHVFSGPQESAKTLAAYAIGLEVIRTGRTVVLIDFEMGAYAARNRWRELGATPADLAALLYLEPDEPATPERISLLIGLSPSIVIIDAAAGAYDLQGLDDNKRQDVERWTRLYVRDFWIAGIATIVLDHVVKNAETRGKYAIGSERKTGGVDVHIGFDTVTPISRGKIGLYKLHTHKDRDGFLQRGPLAELQLTSDPETHTITWKFEPVKPPEPGTPWMPTKVMETISRILENQMEPISRNATYQLAGGQREIARQAIDRLIRLGYATEDPGPNRTKLLKTHHLFTVKKWESEPVVPVVPGGSQVVPGTTGFPVVPPPHVVGGSRNHRGQPKTTRWFPANNEPPTTTP